MNERYDKATVARSLRDIAARISAGTNAVQFGDGDPSVTALLKESLTDDGFSRGMEMQRSVALFISVVADNMTQELADALTEAYTNADMRTPSQILKN